MEKARFFGIAILVLTAILTPPPVSGQVAEACTSSIRSFTPCLTFLLGAAIGVGFPSTECCSAVASLISVRMDCTCLILTGNVPFNLPFNRTLAITLPHICGLMSVPLQCKGSAATLPGPGPVSSSPYLLPLPPMPSDPAPPSPAPSPPSPAPSPRQRSEILPRRGLASGDDQLCC